MILVLTVMMAVNGCFATKSWVATQITSEIGRTRELTDAALNEKVGRAVLRECATKDDVSAMLELIGQLTQEREELANQITGQIVSLTNALSQMENRQQGLIQQNKDAIENGDSEVTSMLTGRIATVDAGVGSLTSQFTGVQQQWDSRFEDQSAQLLGFQTGVRNELDRLTSSNEQWRTGIATPVAAIDNTVTDNSNRIQQALQSLIDALENLK